ncbi:NAD(P)-dependent oxidoreductase [Gordonia caeni]|uniref:2-hydroxyacid dehydrogenase family protein n=1 Tax=Gordonia caeni TaxID=1007097 RepID=A0ABP7PB94_9ACTN
MAEIYSAVALPDDSVALLRDAGADYRLFEGAGDITEDQLAAAIGDAEVLISAVNIGVTETVIGAAPKLALIANVGDGYSNIDLDAARARGIAVTNAPTIDSVASTAEQAVALLLAVSRRVLGGDRLMRSGDFTGWEVTGYVGGHQVYGKALLIIGLGRIGRLVAQMLSGFSMTMYYVDPVAADADFVAEYGLTRVELDEGLGLADYVTLHCDLTDDNAGMIDARRLAQMKTSAYLVNAARGPLVVEADLVAALQAGTIAGAALDTYQHEPSISAALASLDNVVLTPHAGNATVEARHEMARDAVGNALAHLRGDQLEYVVT